MSMQIKRKDIKFYPDSRRVIARFFHPGGYEREKNIITKILALSDEDTWSTLNMLLKEYSQRHRNITQVFQKHFNNVSHFISQLDIDIASDALSKEKKMLIGSYFTMEYSIESAALFNPSIVEDPDQTSIGKDEKRVIVSFRATGEGHISSIVFRSGVIDKNNNLSFETPGEFLDIPEAVKNNIYDKQAFIKKLAEMDVQIEQIRIVLDQLNEQFNYEELQELIAETLERYDLDSIQKNVIKDCNWLANSHYEITYSLDTAISERVIFPIADSERNGIEDARFVKFTDDDGSTAYYATYTAYNGFTILPRLIETRDFYHFRVMPINGVHAQNKGMALFPKKINNQYAMMSRLDGVNNYIMLSDDIHYWQNAKLIQQPQFPWQFIQIGNCGSPIETERGWILLTHGVGPMRTYSLGVTLLDLDDPTKVLGQTSEPLMRPNAEEREGYVPNVIYSCGAIIHNNELIIPYAMADYASSFASFALDELFENLFYY